MCSTMCSAQLACVWVSHGHVTKSLSLSAHMLCALTALLALVTPLRRVLASLGGTRQGDTHNQATPLAGARNVER
jgi:hypothetical protein